MESLKVFLTKFDPSELEVLEKLLGLKNTDPSGIVKAIEKTVLPVRGFLQSKLTYREFMERVAKHENKKVDTEHKVVFDAMDDDLAMERKLLTGLYQQQIAQMTPEELEQYSEQLKEEGLNASQIASLTSTAAIGAAQLSGFAVYTLASSTVGAISTALGVTFPFAVYTTMSSVIKVAIGPVGWALLGIMLWRTYRKVHSLEEAWELVVGTGKGIKNFFIGDVERASKVFVYIASVRILKTERVEKQMNNLKELLSENQSLIKEKAAALTGYEEEKRVLTNEIRQLEDRLEMKNMSLSRVQSRQTSLRESIKEFESKEVTLKQQLEGLQRELADLMNKDVLEIQ